MLVTIDLTLGANTDHRNKTVNFMRAIMAVANSANGSTPTCNVISNPAGTLESNQMITVIANTIGGGWSIDLANTNASNGNLGYLFYGSGGSNTYSDSQSYPYYLHMYTDSGKNQYPYRCTTFRTNPNYAFNNSFSSYPLWALYSGIGNTSAWGTGSYDGNYTYGYTTTSSQMADCTNNWSDTSNLGWRFPSANNWQLYQNSTYNTYLGGGNAGGKFYMACTPEYMIIWHPGMWMFYNGTRTTQSWENQYDDNPPAVSFYWSTRGDYPKTHWGWDRVMTINGGAPWAANTTLHKFTSTGVYSYASFANATYTATMPVVGGGNFSGGSSPTLYWVNQYQNRIGYWNNHSAHPYPYTPVPLFYSMLFSYQQTMITSYNSGQNSAQFYAPSIDSTTGQMSAPAIPIVHQLYGPVFNPGGRLKGIYKSMSGRTDFANSLAANEQEITVSEDGSNVAYMYTRLYAVVDQANTYCDDFMIRKA